MSKISDATYEKRLGWINSERTPNRHDGTLCEIDGECWMTKQGLPVVMPDQDFEDEHLAPRLKPLPAGIEAVTLYGEKITT